MIHDIDETLCRMLADELAIVPGCPLQDRKDITMEAPAAVSDDESRPRINVFLYDVRENVELRDHALHRRQKPGEESVGIHRGVVRFDLSYLATCHAGGDAALEHRLLSDLLAVLLRCPIVPSRYLYGVLEGSPHGPVTVSVAQPEHYLHKDPASLWLSFGGALRSSISLVVGAAFDPFETKWTKLVREALIGMGIGATPHGPARPLELDRIRVSAAGVVISQSTEQPLAGVRIAIDGMDKNEWTDDRGFFHFRNLPAGQHVLRFAKPGFSAQEHPVTAPPAGRADQLEPLVVAMRPATEAWTDSRLGGMPAPDGEYDAQHSEGRFHHQTLTGTLKYPDGRPAAYVEVCAGDQRTITDSNGVYLFQNLPPGEMTVVGIGPGLQDAVDSATAEATVRRPPQKRR